MLQFTARRAGNVSGIGALVVVMLGCVWVGWSGRAQAQPGIGYLAAYHCAQAYSHAVSSDSQYHTTESNGARFYSYHAMLTSQAGYDTGNLGWFYYSRAYADAAADFAYKNLYNHLGATPEVALNTYISCFYGAYYSRSLYR